MTTYKVYTEDELGGLTWNNLRSYAKNIGVKASGTRIAITTRILEKYNNDKCDSNPTTTEAIGVIETSEKKDIRVDHIDQDMPNDEKCDQAPTTSDATYVVKPNKRKELPLDRINNDQNMPDNCDPTPTTSDATYIVQPNGEKYFQSKQMENDEQQIAEDVVKSNNQIPFTPSSSFQCIDDQTYVINKTPKFVNMQFQTENDVNDSFFDFEKAEESGGSSFTTSTPLFPKMKPNRKFKHEDKGEFSFAITPGPTSKVQTEKKYINPWRKQKLESEKKILKPISPLTDPNDSIFSTPKNIIKRKCTIPVMSPRLEKLAQPKKYCTKDRIKENCPYVPHKGTYRYIDTTKMKDEDLKQLSKNNEKCLCCTKKN